jgi:Fe-S cluster assembly protein SufD
VILDGLYLVGAKGHADHHLTVHHLAPACVSRQLYKGVLSRESSGAFTGKVVVDPQASRTDSRQRNDSLLLAPSAMANTRPQLQINCRDVQCSHGATVGQLDEQQIYYLRSRGIDEAEAKRVLTYAFASELVERIEDPALQTFAAESVRRRLSQEVRG